jgi:hypothetical protein
MRRSRGHRRRAAAPLASGRLGSVHLHAVVDRMLAAGTVGHEPLRAASSRRTRASSVSPSVPIEAPCDACRRRADSRYVWRQSASEARRSRWRGSLGQDTLRRGETQLSRKSDEIDDLTGAARPVAGHEAARDVEASHAVITSPGFDRPHISLRIRSCRPVARQREARARAPIFLRPSCTMMTRVPFRGTSASGVHPRLRACVRALVIGRRIRDP